MASSDNRWIVGVGTVTTAVLVTIVVLILGPLAGLEMETERLAAILAFFGIVVSGIVTLIGLFLKRIAEHRLEKEREQENDRLMLEAAMQAGSLLAQTGDRPTTPATMASGLLALSKLGQCELAVALLVDLWDDMGALHGDRSGRNMSVATPARVSNETAILTIDAALRSGEKNAPLVAAELLCRNAKRLDACQSLHWPSAVDGRWLPHVGQKTKLLLVDALIRMTTTSPPNENALRSLAVRLFGIWHEDPSDSVKGCIGKLIDTIVPHLEECSYKEFIEGPRVVTLAQLQEAAASKKDKSDHFLAVMMDERCAMLKAWAEQCHSNFSLRCGALGDGISNQNSQTSLTLPALLG
ncbi:hypothetical protein K1T35_37240 [Pseudonocardia sp. DSM 110487]|uniref:hypothetical protein n=1 Tax=Pseudonocardia sp. DSM 110487 TaxID=2865833 RepID=UPI001C699E2D|nr:hypothetical protein [Pseudonocardia sp. DSM 110487]QYN34039.1 hypothetical protein K1T35_37240 [Pseudonocardia sp. DSM 110487]